MAELNMDVIEVTSESWDREVVESKGLLVVVDFWHEGCAWCWHLDLVFTELARDYGERVRFARFNILASEEHIRIANGFRIMGAPTIIFFCDGKPAGELFGFRPKQALREKIDEALARCSVSNGPCLA